MSKTSTLILMLACLCIWSCTSHSNELPVAAELNEAASTDAVSPSKAAQVAELFFRQNSPQGKSASKTIRSIAPIFGKDGTPAMYAINYIGGGFAVVSATEKYYPILAYSDENQFVFDLDNGALAGWIDQTKFAVEQSDKLPDSIEVQIRAIWLQYTPQYQATTTATSKSSSEESAAFYNRINQLQQSHYGYMFYSLDRCSPDMFPLNSYIYESLCNNADNWNSPREYTIVAIKTDVEYSTEVPPLFSTQWQHAMVLMACVLPIALQDA